MNPGPNVLLDHAKHINDLVAQGCSHHKFERKNGVVKFINSHVDALSSASKAFLAQPTQPNYDALHASFLDCKRNHAHSFQWDAIELAILKAKKLLPPPAPRKPSL